MICKGFVKVCNNSWADKFVAAACIDSKELSLVQLVVRQ